MKKLLSGLLLLALMFAFVACNPTPKPTPTPEPEPKQEKEIIYIPGYEFAPTSKGMTDFPAGNPFTSDEWNVGTTHHIGYPNELPSEYQIPTAKVYLACNAMSNMPLLPPMIEYEDYPDSVAKSFEKENLIIFGFPARVKVSKATDDGIYLFIEALEGDKVIAVVEYYYSWKTKTFSYREIVAAFLHNYTLRPLANNIILFEMNNVPVVAEENEKISFSAGVDADGALNAATAIKQYRIELPAPKSETTSAVYTFPFRLVEFHSLMNHTGSLVTSAGYEHYSSEDMITPEEDSAVFNKLVYEFLSETTIKDHYKFSYDSEHQELTLDDDNCNIEFCYDVLTYFFKGFDAFKTKESFNSRVDSIEDMKDFNNLGFEYLDGVEQEFRPNDAVADLHFPVMFNLEENKGTTSDFLDSGLFESWNHTAMLKGFESLFDFVIYEGELRQAKEKFAVDILMKCGLTEQNAEALLPTPTT